MRTFNTSLLTSQNRSRFQLPAALAVAGLFLSACASEQTGHRQSCSNGLDEAQHANDCDRPVIDRSPRPEPRPADLSETLDGPVDLPDNPFFDPPADPEPKPQDVWDTPDGPQWDVDEPQGQNPGNDKPVGNAPWDGERGEEPSGKPKK